MDACTASTCDNLWGRTSFAKVMVNVWATGELKKEIEVVIPRLSGNGEDVVKVVVEYDWEPSQCSICKIFGHRDAVCSKRVVQKEREKPIVVVDNEGFQRPKRKQWRPKPPKATQTVHKAETSNAHTHGTKNLDSLVGVGNIRQIVEEPKQIDEAKQQQSKTGKDAMDGNRQSENAKTSEEVLSRGEFCTINAGRTPKGKETMVNTQPAQSNGPELVKSVVQIFKQQLKPKRGIVISTPDTNRFSPLSSVESSDADDMEIIDTPRFVGEGTDATSVSNGEGAQGGNVQVGDTPNPVSQ